MRDNSGDVHILIVEDSPTQAEQLRHTLTQSGYKVSVAPNGGEALEAIRKQRPTLVISDVVMPEMDGFALCREIKKNLKNVPVILLTALSDPEDVLKGLECGADNFITKPYDENYLLAKIYNFLVDSELRRGSKAHTDGEIFFKGEKYFINSERKQILDLLLSTYETAVMKNHELKRAQEELEKLNEKLHLEIAERQLREEEIRSLNDDLSRRASQIEEADEKIRNQNMVLEGINRIFLEVMTSETEEQLGQACLSVAEEVTQSNFGFVAEMGEDGFLHDIAISDPGWKTCTMYDKTGHRRPPGNFKIHGLYGRVITDGKAFFTNAPASHPDSLGTPENHPPLNAFLGAPLIHDGKTIGMVAVGNRAGGYRIEDLKALEALSVAVVQALMRKRAEVDVLKLSEDMADRNLELEDVNKELEAFIYSVAHDLRAPLRTISGFIKILTEDYVDRLDVQGRDYMNRVYKGSAKMSKLIEDLLYLSHISRQEINRIEFNMSNRASSIIEDMREVNPGRSVEVNIQEGLAAFADPGLTEVVLSNLLGNAWKFTSKTEKARIEFGAFEREGKTVYFVRDNGTGFDPNYKEKLFAPFQRLHSDKEFEGTGIGLSIVERIIRRHGGRIWTEGEKEKGATFFFTLN